MNPSYKLQIDVVLLKPVQANDIILRYVRYLPFVPRSGDTIRLTSEDEENILDLTLETVWFDAGDGMFSTEIEDDVLQNEFREGGHGSEREAVESYKSFGFVRVTFPAAQIVRAVEAEA